MVVWKQWVPWPPYATVMKVAAEGVAHLLLMDCPSATCWRLRLRLCSATRTTLERLAVTSLKVQWSCAVCRLPPERFSSLLSRQHVQTVTMIPDTTEQRQHQAIRASATPTSTWRQVPNSNWDSHIAQMSGNVRQWQCRRSSAQCWHVLARPGRWQSWAVFRCRAAELRWNAVGANWFCKVCRANARCAMASQGPLRISIFIQGLSIDLWISRILTLFWFCTENSDCNKDWHENLD